MDCTQIWFTPFSKAASWSILNAEVLSTRETYEHANDNIRKLWKSRFFFSKKIMRSYEW